LFNKDLGKHRTPTAPCHYPKTKMHAKLCQGKQIPIISHKKTTGTIIRTFAIQDAPLSYWVPMFSGELNIQEQITEYRISCTI
jgi:hypothetical protein